MNLFTLHFLASPVCYADEFEQWEKHSEACTYLKTFSTGSKLKDSSSIMNINIYSYTYKQEWIDVTDIEGTQLINHTPHWMAHLFPKFWLHQKLWTASQKKKKNKEHYYHACNTATSKSTAFGTCPKESWLFQNMQMVLHENKSVHIVIFVWHWRLVETFHRNQHVAK